MTDASYGLLIIDDDDLTAECFQRSLGKVGGAFQVVPAEDGVEALDILYNRSAKHVKRPFIVLLDLNMPRMNGFEFLNELRADPQLRGSVVFILSTSDAELDVARAYENCVAGYMVKSIPGTQYSQIAKMLVEYSQTVHMQSEFNTGVPL
jgi:CheY-like chemotaxis protein